MPEKERPYDVFISYSYSDKDMIREIVAQLKDHGVRVFLDSENIPIGSDLNVALERGLYKSKVLLVFVSKESRLSQWVEKEIKTFLSLPGGDRRVVGITLDDIPASELPPYLRDSTLLRWQDTEGQVQKLVEGLGLSKDEIATRGKGEKRWGPDAMLQDKEGRNVVVEFKLDTDLPKFTIDQQEQFLKALADLLGVDVDQIVIKNKRAGTVTYELVLTPEQAAHVMFAISHGEITELKQFDLRSVRKVDTSNRIFIGHGRSPLWRELKDFIQDRLRLQWDEFNRESVAGLATSERLDQMLAQSGFAFLLMTAEDLHGDNELHARENVVHEIGLFQGKLGRRKAIILLEEGCAEFSNIVGLTQIRFPRGNISACFEEIRRVLEREGLLSQS